MAKTVTIQLLDPIEGFPQPGQRVESITLKEPNGALFMELGEPRIQVGFGEHGYFLEQPQVINAYLQRLMEGDHGSMLLPLMSLTDTMELKEQLFRFFYNGIFRRISRDKAISSSSSTSSPQTKPTG
jgi:hypothetical protein